LDTPKSSTEASTAAGGPEPELTIPVIEEVATVGKRRVDTGKGIRIAKTVTEHEEIVDEPLQHEELRVERVAIDRVLDSDEQRPSMRQEGDITIMPVLEEVLVIEKRTVLKEELRITRVRREMRAPQRVSLRSEKVTTEPLAENHAGRRGTEEHPPVPTAGESAGINRQME
jgi:uncharacterized protein (TIGR02271 family)